MRRLNIFEFIKDGNCYFFIILVLFFGFVAIEFIGCCSILFQDCLPLNEVLKRGFKAIIFVSLILGSTVIPLMIILISKIFYAPIVLLSLWSLFAFANLLHVRLFSMIIPFSMYSNTQNVNGLFDSIVELLKVSDILYLIIPVLVVVIYYLIRPTIEVVSLKKRLITASVIFCFSILPVFGYIFCKTSWNGKGEVPETETLLYYYRMCPKMFYCDFGCVNSLIAEATSNYISNKCIYTHEDDSRIKSYLSTIPPLFFQEREDSLPVKKNLIILLVESFNSKPLTTKIGDRYIMPNVVRLMEDSQTLVTHKIKHPEQAGSSIAGQFNVLTGLIAVNDKVITFDYPRNVYPSIIKGMRNSIGNVSSAVVLPTDREFWGQLSLNSSVGVERIFDKENMGMKNTGRSEWICDRQMFRFGLDEIIRRKHTPFCYLLVTGDMHCPYVKESECDLVFPPDYPIPLKAYYSRVNNDDRYIGEFIDNLKKVDGGRVYEESLIVICSDHNVPMWYMQGIVENEDITDIRSISAYTPALFVNTGQDMSVLNDSISRYEFVQEQIYPTMLSLLRLSKENYTGLFPSMLDIESCKEWDFSDVSRGTSNQRMQEAFKVSDLIIKSNYFGRSGQF